MSTDPKDWLRGGTPGVPWYAQRKPRKRRGPVRFRTQRPEYYDKKRAMLAKELSKPVNERTGRLKTMRSGDFSAAEIVRIIRKAKERKK